MAVGLTRAPSQENVSTTLSSGITDVATTMTVADASKFQSPCYLVIDRVDSAGTLKATSLWEYVKVTNIAGNDLTITRSQGGSTGQAHSSGAVVEAVVTAAQFEDYFDALDPEHTASGGHVIGTATVNYVETHRLAVTSVASIAQMNIPFIEANSGAITSIASIARGEFTNIISSNASISNVYVSSHIAASGASLTLTPHSFRAFNNTSVISLTNNTNTIFGWDSETWDIGAFHDTTTNPSRFTVPSTGKYMFTFNGSIGGSGTGDRYVDWLVNGTHVSYGPRYAGSANGDYLNSTYVGLVSAGMYVEVSVFQNSGGGLAVANGTNQTWISGVKISD